MKKILSTIGATVLAGAMCLSIFGGCGSVLKTDLSGYVAVDINPSVEFITDSDGVVEEVRGANYDAEIIISDMELVGKPIDKAVEMLTKTAEETGYLNQSNTDVSITVGAETDKAEDKLIELAEKGVKKGSEIAEIKGDEIRAELEQKVNDFKARRPERYKDLSVAKLKIIQSIMEYDESFTVAEGTEMSMEELVEILKEYINDFEGVGKEMSHEFKARVHELTAEIKKQIDMLFGEEYAQKMELLRKLDMLEEKFEFELEKAENEGTGDGETLTEEMITEVNAIISDAQFTTLSEFEEYIEALENEINEIRESVDLSEIQKELIEQFEQSIKEVQNNVVENMRPKMEQAKQGLKDIKHELREQHK